jgi:hypothetical protein|tara:strand:+ start:855 stop:1157 length:303 start_codon:yes stop_codon:yes gene_type:complete
MTDLGIRECPDCRAWKAPEDFTADVAQCKYCAGDEEPEPQTFCNDTLEAAAVQVDVFIRNMETSEDVPPAGDATVRDISVMTAQRIAIGIRALKGEKAEL